VQAVVGLPVIEAIQPAPLTAKGIIQRSPCDVQRTRKRGGAAWDVSFQPSLVDSRAPHQSDKSRVLSKIQCEQPNYCICGTIPHNTPIWRVMWNDSA